MQLIAASARGLFSGWLLALTVPLLMDAMTISAWRAAGLGNQARIGLAIAELSGAALFAFEPLIAAGFGLLLGAFAFAAAVHIHFGKAPWHLAFYALLATLLVYFSKRGQHLETAS